MESSYTRSETFFKGYDQTKLFLQTWIRPDAVGTVFFTHGQAEHSDCYHRLIQGLQQIKDATRWNFVGWDLRGHGRSDGIRGYARDFDEYVLDFEKFIEIALRLEPVQNKPIILLAHSMGGLVQTCALLEKKYAEHFPQIKGQILSSPLFDVSVPVPTWKDSGAEFLNKILPKITLGNEIKNEMLTRDPAVIREYEKDTYRHNKISSGVYLGFKREFQRCAQRAADIQVPTLLILSDNDPIISSTAAMKIFDQFSNPEKSLKIFENAKHEIFNDTCRDEAFKAVQQFLDSKGK